MKKQTLEKDCVEKTREEFVKGLVEGQRIHENGNYGEFIIQANEVQYYLTSLISIRSSIPNKRLNVFLERLQLGNLIGCFRIQAKNHFEIKLIDSLEKYNNLRNALAHKMFTDKKLTIKECKLSIKLGCNLIIILKKLINVDMERMKKLLNSNPQK